VFNLWAPSAGSIELLEVGCLPRRMPRDADGWYQCLSVTAHVGTRYRFRINGKLIVLDPASFFQPDDVSEPNEVLDSAALRDPILYPGRPWAETVIYECMSVPLRLPELMLGRSQASLFARLGHHGD
jgi:maltooligosyltrehalose trehalohydrolase